MISLYNIKVFAGYYTDKAKMIEENNVAIYIKEHGHKPPDYFNAFIYLSIICIILMYYICSYLFCDIPYTKQLIKKGEIEDNGLIADLVRKVIIFFVIIIGMGIYTAFTWTYPGYFIVIGIGLLIGLLFNGINDSTKKRYFERYKNKFNMKI